MKIGRALGRRYATFLASIANPIDSNPARVHVFCRATAICLHRTLRTIRHGVCGVQNGEKSVAPRRVRYPAPTRGQASVAAPMPGVTTEMVALLHYRSVSRIAKARDGAD